MKNNNLYYNNNSNENINNDVDDYNDVDANNYYNNNYSNNKSFISIDLSQQATTNMTTMSSPLFRLSSSPLSILSIEEEIQQSNYFPIPIKTSLISNFYDFPLGTYNTISSLTDYIMTYEKQRLYQLNQNQQLNERNINNTNGNVNQKTKRNLFGGLKNKLSKRKNSNNNNVNSRSNNVRRNSI
ncbi:9630_t:CDS:2 [Entrophospora sp. SA101]|nr:9630_t:CDS:2 [Entrophospora sp. SA101]